MAHDVDFLPSSYREAGAYHRDAKMRFALVAVFIGIAGCAAIYQQHLYRKAQKEFAELTPLHDGAVAARKYLGELQERLEAAEQQAQLATYLEHAWPRSRILVLLAEPLPPSIELESLKINRERLHVPVDAAKPTPPTPPGDQPPKEPAPAERDLTALRDEFDKTYVVVILTGLTHDLAEVHRYLDQLARLPLFTKIDLSSAERVMPEESGLTRFTVRVRVKPGYGEHSGSTDHDKLTKATVTP